MSSRPSGCGVLAWASLPAQRVLRSLGGGICFSLRTAHRRSDINRARPHLVFVANVVVLRNQGVLLELFIVAERKIGAVVAAAAFFAGECAARNQ